MNIIEFLFCPIHGLGAVWPFLPACYRWVKARRRAQ